eukprot:GSMAST32.ASY1.ANO1.2133.1 assembled CDS
MNTLPGLSLIEEAIYAIRTSIPTTTRVTFIHNPKQNNMEDVKSKSLHALHNLISKSSSLNPFLAADRSNKSDVKKRTMIDYANSLEMLEISVKNLRETFGSSQIGNSKQSNENYSKDTKLLYNDVVKMLGISPGGTAVCANGWLVTIPFVFQNHEINHRTNLENNLVQFEALDFSLMDSIERSRRASYLNSLLPMDATSNDVMQAASFAGVYSMSTRQHFSAHKIYDKYLSTSYVEPQNSSKKTKNGRLITETASIEVVAIINPLSSSAQHIQDVDIDTRIPRLSILVHFNPKQETKELPLKRFYRSSTSTPESWNIIQTESPVDTDNIQLSLHDSIDVGLQLKHLLLAGHSANGVQIFIKNADVFSNDFSDNERSDTVVMQNLGYWQLKSNPGIWSLHLSKGITPEIYAIHNIDNSKENVFDEFEEFTLQPIMRKFSPQMEQLNVVRRRGMENRNLLDVIDEDVETEDTEITQGVTKVKKGVKKATNQAMNLMSMKDHSNLPFINNGSDTIHIFSVATGHLYERFLKIMMLSVNFLSPGFINDVKKLSISYRFEVDLVTYTWPSWLRKQTVKQRIIWGYKILFLDVLFPLHVKKVIYIDADTIIRTDIKELWDLDLDNHVYAYAPFCQTNTETLGYQFWNEGFWKDHLRGLPYHISALYVVDLVLFRHRGIGDKLRSVYDHLSRDPQSLSNLDQDLPNYTQHMVPIFTLPQSWLWCESWCSASSLLEAKAVDLCNNPRHKEAKLDMARRIISAEHFEESWTELDEEVSKFQNKKNKLDDNYEKIDL